MRRLAFAAWAILAFAGVAAAGEATEGFKPLFDGKSLEGWSGDTDLWKVEDGCIAGSTDDKPIKHNTFLATTKSYKNFILRLKFKLRNGNSGVQVRSKQFPDFVVRGYQPDIAESRYTGMLYEEGGRGILADVKPDEVAKLVKKGDWNQYVITCDGPKIKLELNGTTTVDYTEKDEKKGATEGIIAFQLHVGAKMKVWFKDVELKELQ